jgi:hypothetical protein
MEAASRPPLELLPDLPVEEPADGASARREPPSAPRAAASAAAPVKSAAPSRDPEQTGLNFVDPEMFLGSDEKPSATQAVTAPPPASDSGLELLEDPVVDVMLETPAPMKPAAAPAREPPAATASASKPSSIESAASAAAARAAARVPIAKTPSLAVAATKLAAASAANLRPAAKVASGATPAPTLRTAPPAAAALKAAPAAKPAVPLRPVIQPKPAAMAETPRVASPAPKVAPAESAPNPAAAARSAPAKATAAAAASAAPGQTMPSPPMDRDFVARNQVVERYLSGRLPVKGATDFERFCAEHPELLDEIGLPERVNAGLRLLEASGKPEPWQEAARPAWQKPQVTIGLAAAAGVLLVALALVSVGSASKSHRITELEKESHDRVLDPATSTREIRLMPSRSAASNSPSITIGGVGAGAQLADFRIDESRSPYHAFRVTIDRIDQGRVAVISNLAKDSNGHLRIALNSSALGPGNYQLTLEGLDWRGEPQPDSWVTIGITR